MTKELIPLYLVAGAFAVIHDSFGTHAANSEALAQTLRETFVAMYDETNVLQGFLNDMAEVVGGEFKEEVPKLPRVGKLELKQVVDSVYFFG